MKSIRVHLRNISRRTYILLSALLIIVFGSSVAWAMHLGASTIPLRQYFAGNYTNAIWYWGDPDKTNQRQLGDMAEFMYLHQLNAIYVDVSKYAAVFQGAPTTQQKEQVGRFNTTMERFVNTLGQRRIKVYAAAGDTSWSNPPEWKVPLSIMQGVEQYNQLHPKAQLAGIEFDIEAYNQPGFAESSMSSKGLVLGDYLGMVDALAAENEKYTKGSHKLELGFAIPYWFDNQNGNIPPVVRNNLMGPTLFHLLDRLNKLQKSNVVVMAYRNAARGNDGIIFHARTNIAYAQAKAPNVRVIIGQETTDVQPAKITYHGMTKTDMSNQVALMEQEFSSTGVFGGIAINDFDGYQQLRDGN
ncbi:MAG TPA: hypothetical protein VIR03_00255 [Candidatus Saccharimonadales bacterium]